MNPDVTAAAVPVTIPAKLCSLSNVTMGVDAPALLMLVTLSPIPNVFTNASALSLVILFLRSSVWTSPIGDLNAKVFADFGLSSKLSLSSWGYRSVTFWLYFKSVNSWLIALFEFSR